MTKVPGTWTSLEESVEQSDEILLRATAQANDPTRSAAESARAALIAEDAKKLSIFHTRRATRAAGGALLMLSMLTTSAIASNLRQGLPSCRVNHGSEVFKGCRR